MYRSNTCGELRLSDAGKEVTLAGWVQRTRKMGGMTFVDLRDRYGITQLVFNEAIDAQLCERANKLGREYCIQVIGTVSERESKNKNIPTGEIEIIAKEMNIFIVFLCFIHYLFISLHHLPLQIHALTNQKANKIKSDEQE